MDACALLLSPEIPARFGQVTEGPTLTRNPKDKAFLVRSSRRRIHISWPVEVTTRNLELAREAARMVLAKL